ncbi:MAG: TetR/AcrR family transcriptional regulator [Conexibacter sp.]
MSTTETRARRTQEQRRAATRAALLDAALACLVEHGYEGTTTGRVCERAGVSRGAHQHHFGTRPELVAAALEELAMRRLQGIRGEVASLPAGDARVEQALDAIWGWFTGPLFQASIDLAAAARTDEELRAQLAPVEARLSQGTLLCCREMLADGQEDRSRDPLIQMTLGTVRGLALLPIIHPGNRSAAKQWAFARARLAELFRLAAASPAR